MSERIDPAWADIGKPVIVIATGEPATVSGYYGTHARLVRFDGDGVCTATFDLDDLTYNGAVNKRILDLVRDDSASENVSRESNCPVEADNSSKPTNPKDLIGIRKAPMSTISGAVLAEIGVAMLEGAAKYGRHNYRAVGVRASVYYDGTQRHLIDWWEGQDIDPDSLMNHITKAITSLTVLRDAMIQGKWVDDRPPRSVPYREEMNARAAAILDKHADKNPRHYTIADTAGNDAEAGL